MFKFIRTFVFASVLFLSLTLNAALVVSEFAYNIAYGLISNAISILHDTAKLTSSVGWKKSKLNKELGVLDKKLLDSTNKLKRQTDDIFRLKNERLALRTNVQELSGETLKKQNEINALKKTNQAQRNILKSKISEADEVRRKLSNANESLLNADKKLSALTQSNKSLQTDHDAAKKNLSKLRNDLASNKLQNKQLREAISNQTRNVVKLTKNTSAQLAQIAQTKKIIRETTDRTTKRIVKRVTRNIAAMPFESVPVAGIAITVGTIYLEIQDACQSLKEFDEMKFSLGFDENTTETDTSYCALNKDDLVRLITNRTTDFEACILQNDLETDSDVEDLMICLPEQIEAQSIPEFDTFEKPAPPEL